MGSWLITLAGLAALGAAIRLALGFRIRRYTLTGEQAADLGQRLRDRLTCAQMEAQFPTSFAWMPDDDTDGQWPEEAL